MLQVLVICDSNDITCFLVVESYLLSGRCEENWRRLLDNFPLPRNECDHTLCWTLYHAYYVAVSLVSDRYEHSFYFAAGKRLHVHDLDSNRSLSLPQENIL